MDFNNIKYEKLSYWIDYSDEIPDDSGIYFWVHWPDFDYETIDVDALFIQLLKYTKTQLLFSEDFKGKYKFHGTIYESWYPENGRVFGLSEEKEKSLKEYLKDRYNLILFYDLFQEICFYKPFYIGKANKLKRRLRDHFNRKSEILDKLDTETINYDTIWVGYKILESPTIDNLNVIFEEIFSRALKLGLTKKPN